MAAMLDDEDDEFFVRLFKNQTKDLSKVIVNVGLTEVEITDFNMRKLIETLVIDWPHT
jgi:hypothetical protein